MANSFINPLFTIQLSDLETLLNKNIPQVFYDDSVGSGTDIKATKEGTIKLNLEFNRIQYQVPIRLQVKKDVGITNASTNCKLLMQFKTVFVIASDWSIRTKTELVKYGWLEKPQLDLGIVAVPITTILEGVIASKQDLICSAIDEQVTKLNAAQYVQSFLSNLPNPVITSLVGPIYWSSTAVESSLHPLEVKDNQVQLTVGLKSDLTLGFGKAVESSILEVRAPEFTKNKRVPSQLKLKTKTALATIQDLFNQQFSGQTFDVEQYKLTPSEIKISCDGKRMTLQSKLAGSFQGQVTLHGVPFFNPEDKTLYCRDVDVELEGAGFKSKSIVVLASKLIMQKVKENLKIPLDPLVSEINKDISHFKLDSSLTLKAYIIEYKLANLQMSTDSIDVDVDLEGLVSVMF